MELTECERKRNVAILDALEKQRKEFAADPVKAREFMMKLGIWNDDGSLKDDEWS